MFKKIVLGVILIILTTIILFNFQSKNNENITNTDQNINLENRIEPNKNENYIDYEIQLQDIDGDNNNFIFEYKDEIYNAKYTTDNWKIINSYKITDKNDIQQICQALINIHPIHGKDMESYRTAEDLADEWIQHNIAYNFLSDGSEWKQNVKDVDLNPEDQGKSLLEIYQDRINK
ncbi:MAG: hypothetical protein IKF52_05320 [Clostridia bacterium]|nr:hypothetical protein [Clostridia bacterium]